LETAGFVNSMFFGEIILPLIRNTTSVDNACSMGAGERLKGGVIKRFEIDKFEQPDLGDSATSQTLLELALRER